MPSSGNKKKCYMSNSTTAGAMAALDLIQFDCSPASCFCFHTNPVITVQRAGQKRKAQEEVVCIILRYKERMMAQKKMQ